MLDVIMILVMAVLWIITLIFGIIIEFKKSEKIEKVGTMIAIVALIVSALVGIFFVWRV